MTPAWTESLVPPLASALRGRAWRRVDEGRDGGWIAEEDAPGHAWSRLAPAATEFESFTLFEDARLPQVSHLVAEWLGAGATIRVLAHRFESRMVLRVADERLGTRIAKLYRRSAAQAVRWSLLARNSDDGVWRVPGIFQWQEPTKLLLVEDCPGESLHDLWLRGGAEASDGDMLRSLLDWIAATQAPADFPSHTAEDEVAVLRHELQRHERMLATPLDGARPLVAEVCERLENLRIQRWVMTHRDLHDKQILRRGSLGILIDLDLCATAPDGLDHGNVLAHLRLRALQGASVPWQEIAVRTMTPRASVAQRDAIALWTAASLTRLALLYGRRSHRAGLLTELARSAKDALRRQGEWSGIL